MPLTKSATFRQLATFHTVARLGSVSAAADEMHLTQPAVSIQLKLLEESAGAPLLERAGRGVRAESSSAAIWIDTAGCVRCISSAAAETLPSRATVWKVASCRNVALFVRGMSRH